MVDFISRPVSHIIKVKESIFPCQWKTAKIINLKKNNRELLSGLNNRPIIVLPLLSKIMEKVPYHQIQEYLVVYGLNTICQHAYKNNHSTATALIQTTEYCLEKIDEMLIGLIFLDLSAAFDVLNTRSYYRNSSIMNFSCLRLGRLKATAQIEIRTFILLAVILMLERWIVESLGRVVWEPCCFLFLLMIFIGVKTCNHGKIW